MCLFGICFFIIVLFFETETVYIFAAMILCFLCFWAPVSEFHDLLKRYVKPFTYGHFVCGTVVNAHKNSAILAGSANWKISYEYDVRGHSYKSSVKQLPLGFLDENIKSGEHIRVFYLNEYPKVSAPKIGELYDFFNFRKGV